MYHSHCCLIEFAILFTVNLCSFLLVPWFCRRLSSPVSGAVGRDTMSHAACPSCRSTQSVSSAACRHDRAAIAVSSRWCAPTFPCRWSIALDRSPSLQPPTASPSPRSLPSAACPYLCQACDCETTSHRAFDGITDDGLELPAVGVLVVLQLVGITLSTASLVVVWHSEHLLVAHRKLHQNLFCYFVYHHNYL